MWCHNCEKSSFSEKTTIRLTNDQHEVLIQICGICKRKSETEYYKGSTVRITDNPPVKKSTKKLKKNLIIKVKTKNGKKLSRTIKKTSLGNKLR